MKFTYLQISNTKPLPYNLGPETGHPSLQKEKLATLAEWYIWNDLVSREEAASNNMESSPLLGCYCHRSSVLRARDRKPVLIFTAVDTTKAV